MVSGWRGLIPNEDAIILLYRHDPWLLLLRDKAVTPHMRIKPPTAPPAWGREGEGTERKDEDTHCYPQHGATCFLVAMLHKDVIEVAATPPPPPLDIVPSARPYEMREALHRLRSKKC